MININIISPREKKNVVSIKAYYIIKKIIFYLFSLLLIVATVLGFTYLLLKNNKLSVEQQLEQEKLIAQEAKLSSTEEIIKELNSQLKTVEQIQGKYILWTNLIKDFSNSVPDGIELHTTLIDRITKQVKITGLAQNREILLSFQETMKEFTYFDNVVYPISNLIEKENINFEISGILSDRVYE